MLVGGYRCCCHSLVNFQAHPGVPHPHQHQSTIMPQRVKSHTLSPVQINIILFDGNSENKIWDDKDADVNAESEHDLYVLNWI